jgi:hypothetical protein
LFLQFEENRSETRSCPWLLLNTVTARSSDIKFSFVCQPVWHVGTRAKQGQSLHRC